MITVTMVENLNEKYIASVTGLDSSSRSYWPQSHSVPPPPPMDAIEQINAIIVVKGKKGQLGIC